MLTEGREKRQETNEEREPDLKKIREGMWKVVKRQRV